MPQPSCGGVDTGSMQGFTLTYIFKFVKEVLLACTNSSLWRSSLLDEDASLEQVQMTTVFQISISLPMSHEGGLFVPLSSSVCRPRSSWGLCRMGKVVPLNGMLCSSMIFSTPLGHNTECTCRVIQATCLTYLYTNLQP